jgi:hypothetical protein
LALLAIVNMTREEGIGSFVTWLMAIKETCAAGAKAISMLESGLAGRSLAG